MKLHVVVFIYTQKIKLLVIEKRKQQKAAISHPHCPFSPSGYIKVKTEVLDFELL